MNPRILHSPLTGKFYIVTRYTQKDTHIVAHTKYDCTDQIDQIVMPVVEQRDALLEACELLYQLNAEGVFSIPDEHYRAITMAAAAIDKVRGTSPPTEEDGP